ncbi:hypothetical protein GALMADRAFT_250588 [Galerina marginata CBS 339.88]|uniref:Uncharacterized protein n=1 Tax=Galerina marginata (strain CBS 339.88) TaxID=685588 RepID=A0A067SSL9_GALM3|nr:hypothetical protein GALMADRAFT_250588 [Galerina marginata CBS 339.88]
MAMLKSCSSLERKHVRAMRRNERRVTASKTELASLGGPHSEDEAVLEVVLAATPDHPHAFSVDDLAEHRYEPRTVAFAMSPHPQPFLHFRLTLPLPPEETVRNIARRSQDAHLFLWHSVSIPKNRDVDRFLFWPTCLPNEAEKGSDRFAETRTSLTPQSDRIHIINSCAVRTSSSTRGNLTTNTQIKRH